MNEQSGHKKPGNAAPPADSADSSVVPASPASTPVTGRRQAFDDVLTPLTPQELSSPGTQKIILYMLQQAQSENDQLEGYRERFNDADKRAAILEEQLKAERKTSVTVEIIIIGGTTLGGAVFAAGFYFLGKTPPEPGAADLSFIVGLLMIAGAIAARVAKR
jgi:hypothetical protein